MEMRRLLLDGDPRISYPCSIFAKIRNTLLVLHYMFAYLNNKMKERCGENSLEEDYSWHKNIGRYYLIKI